MAAPHVAGVAALVLSAHLSDAVPFTVEQVRQALRRGSDDIGDAGFDEQFGYGRINATKALAEADPLEALITSPSGNFVFRPFLGPETIVDAVDVRGIAKGPDFVSYTVEYGAGATPTSWTTLATSTTPVSTAGPLASLDTVPDGVYTLRLTARNTNGQVYEDRQPVKIERLWLVNPLAGPKFTAFRGGSVKSIAGVVNPRNFLSYRVEVREFPSGILVPNADITLTDGGTHTILLDSSGNPGVLATWNTVGVPAGYYVIRVVATLTDGSEVLEEAQVIVDPTLHPGWPINLGRVQGVDGIPYRGHLNAADVNLDGKADLLVGYGETVRVHDHTGAWLPGWPESNGLFLDGDFDTGVTAGDLTGDGVPEVVAGNNDGLIFVWSSSGDQLPIPWGGYSNGVSESPYAWTAIADVDGNGTNEIVTTDGTGTVNLFGNSGQLPDWPQTLGFSGGSDASPPVVGDIDGDGRKEIAVIGLHPPNDLYVLSSNGEILPGWPRAMSPTVTVADTFLMQPVMGELDSDALKEIVVCAADGLVHVLNHDGSEVPGWPQATPIGQEGSCSPPVIADVDGDGRSEVVVGVLSFEDHYVDLLYAWHRNGTLLSGWPIRYDVTDLVRFGFSGAAVADLDGDGRADVTASRDGRYALGAYAPDGAELPGFPKPTIAVGAQDASTPAVADFDGDGLLELAWIDQDRNVYMWDLDGPSSGAQPWPVFNRDAQRTGANLPALDRLAYDSYTGLTEVDGNGNGWVDPGETWELYVNLRNNGASSVSGVSANLAVDWLPTAGMVYLGPDSSDYGTIAPGQVVPSLQAYRFRVAENFPCGGGISLSVTGLTSTDGSSPDAVGVIRIPVGTDSLYYDGFEPRSDGLYWSADVDWQSGVPGGLGAPQPDPASAYEGQRIMGTDLTGLGATPGNYENGVTSYLTSPGIRIPFGLQPTEIKFAHWINLAAGDYVTMHVYSDIPGDQKYFQWGSLLNASSWTLSSFDISDMAPGKSFLQVEFILQTDAQSTSSGFNMDAFEVRASGPVCEAITSSLPGEATNLRASKGPAGKLTLEWNGDCGAATNFAIYRGDLGIGYSSLAQEPGACDVTGTTATIPLGPGSAEFFLVVPHTDAGEGSYGVGVGGTQRTPATGACYVQGVVDVCAL
jgi:hypothetical protein